MDSRNPAIWFQLGVLRDATNCSSDDYPDWMALSIRDWIRLRERDQIRRRAGAARADGRDTNRVRT